jgi:ATP-binding cassette, subfamily G (WHITE), eye pigment precursor transporter
VGAYMSSEMINDSINICKTAKNPVKLSWENLNYEVEIKVSAQEASNSGKSSYKQQIIKNVSGYAMPGQALFIMGASGAGKTSLLNILSDRVKLRDGASLTGKRTINDTMKCDDSNFGLVSGYVMQDDILYSHFTPREALTFAANLKLGHMSEEEKQKKINELIDQLGLKGA